MATLAEHLVVHHGIDPDAVFEMTPDQRRAQHTEDHAPGSAEQMAALHGWFESHAPTDRPSVKGRVGIKGKWLRQYRQRVKIAKEKTQGRL